MRSYLSKLFLSLALASTTKAARITRQALDIRGGWTPLDGPTTAKAITGLGLAVGTTTSFSAETVLDKCGLGDIGPCSVLVARRTAESVLCFSIIAYFLIFQGASAPTAVGISCLPLIVEGSKTVFDGTHKELGFTASGQVVFVLVTSIFSILFLNDSPVSKDVLLKIHSGWILFNGVLMGCFPQLACTAWGSMDANGLIELQKFVSLWGFSLLSLGTLSGCLASGMMTNKALALSTIPFLSKLVLFRK